MKKMADRLVSNEAFAADYKNRSWRLPGHISTCDQSCREEVACEARYFDPYETKQCNGETIYDW